MVILDVPSELKAVQPNINVREHHADVVTLIEDKDRVIGAGCLDDLKPGKEGGEGFGTALLKMGGDKGFVVGDRVRKFRSPDSIFVVVAGGTAGRFSVAIPGWVAEDLGSTPVTKRIQVD